MTLTQMIYRSALLVIAFAILTALGMILIPVIRNANALRTEKAALETEIAAKEERILQLKSYQERFINDPDFVEHTARQLGLVAPGETIYEFGNTTP